VSQNQLAILLGLTLLGIIIVGWIVQLGGNYRAGSNRYGSGMSPIKQDLQLHEHGCGGLLALCLSRSVIDAFKA
jgi:hypothetical protein